MSDSFCCFYGEGVVHLVLFMFEGVVASYSEWRVNVQK